MEDEGENQVYGVEVLKGAWKGSSVDGQLMGLRTTTLHNTNLLVTSLMTMIRGNANEPIHRGGGQVLNVVCAYFIPEDLDVLCFNTQRPPR
jgi:hypothetical protein